MATTGDSCFWLADFLNSSPLKLLGQMIRNLVGSIYGRSSIKSTRFVPIPFTNMAVYLAKLCQSRRFLEIDQSEKRIVCGGHVC
jgi:hypothetical protein